MRINLILAALFSLLFIVALPVFSVASLPYDQQQALIDAVEKLKTAPPVVAFDKNSLKEVDTLCKYANTPYLTTSAVPAPFFQGVKGIYLNSSKYTFDELKLPFLEPSTKISELAGCILQRHLTVGKNKTPGIPIYIPERKGIPMAFWPEAKDDGNIIIWIEIGMRQDPPWFDKLTNGGLMMAKVIYARHGFDPIEQIHLQCASPFPYTKDQDKLLKFLTKALSTCLTHKYQYHENF